MDYRRIKAIENIKTILSDETFNEISIAGMFETLTRPVYRESENKYLMTDDEMYNATEVVLKEIDQIKQEPKENKKQ